MRIMYPLILTIFCWVLSGLPVFAQEPAEDAAPPAMETSPLERIEALSKNMIVIELFTSQACVFCPKADEFIKDFEGLNNIIALSCHIDYFDVKAGSLSLPECSQRQEAYEADLRQGPKYTPQMVIDGATNIVGYRRADVWRALDEHAAAAPLRATILPVEATTDAYDLTLPEVAVKDLELTLFIYERPKEVTVADGGNKGKKFTYYNTVSAIKPIGNWAGDLKTIRLDIKYERQNAGFAILAQDKTSGKIVAAGKYSFPPAVSE